MIRALPVLLLASASHAQPLFEDRSDDLPEHIYGGGWEHFVGGGVAVFDCNGDDLPDIFAAGGGGQGPGVGKKGGLWFGREWEGGGGGGGGRIRGGPVSIKKKK